MHATLLGKKGNVKGCSALGFGQII